MTDKPIFFASDDRLRAVEHLAPRFFAEIIGIDYDDCFISDYSAIGDFFDASDAGEAEVEARLDLIAELYSVDVRHLGTHCIVDILEFLASKGITE